MSREKPTHPSGHQEPITPSIRLLIEAHAELTVENWMTVNFIAEPPEGDELAQALAQAKTEIEDYLREHPEGDPTQP